ncbi:Cytochrome P450 4c21 [Orchesella cincta]|uniref:Cytochrome P450 4c21 n=1 Tax=Orchesella cincta TaxID=48709 RepID=A0A1D2MSP0_ORCCI|nr:Cytochrome P450 4c21 [Orchesella cincta]
MGVRKHSHKQPVIPSCIPIIPTLPVIGSVHHFLKDRDLLQFTRKWASKLGPIFGISLFGTPVVVLNDPVYLQKLLGSSEPGHLTRPTTHTNAVVPKNFHFGVLPGDGELWKHQRSIVLKAFSYESLKSYIPIMNLHAERLVQDLGVQASNPGSGPITNLQDKFYMLALRVITHILIGKDLCVEEEGYQFVKDFHHIEETMARFISSPWLAVPPFSWWFSKEREEVGRRINNCKKIMQKMLDEYRNDGFVSNQFRSVMNVLLEQGMENDEQIMSECFWLTLAGNNTVGLSLLYILFNLAQNSEHQRICREEADELFNEMESKGGKMEMDGILKLSHMDRCIKESLRRVTVVPGSIRQLSSPLKLDENMVLSEGTIVLAFHELVHNNPGVFPNPKKFDPDRFLPENIKERNHYAFTPFSAGRRDCLGNKLAMIELKVVVAWILRNFEVATIDNYDTVKFKYYIMQGPTKPIRFHLKERNDNKNK